MNIKIKDCHFENNGIGIAVETSNNSNLGLEISETKFINNGAAIVSGNRKTIKDATKVISQNKYCAALQATGVKNSEIDEFISISNAYQDPEKLKDRIKHTKIYAKLISSGISALDITSNVVQIASFIKELIKSSQA